MFEFPLLSGPKSASGGSEAKSASGGSGPKSASGGSEAKSALRRIGNSYVYPVFRPAA